MNTDLVRNESYRTFGLPFFRNLLAVFIKSKIEKNQAFFQRIISIFGVELGAGQFHSSVQDVKQLRHRALLVPYLKNKNILRIEQVVDFNY